MELSDLKDPKQSIIRDARSNDDAAANTEEDAEAATDGNGSSGNSSYHGSSINGRRITAAATGETTVHSCGWGRS